MREQMQLPVEQVCETERVSDEGAARLMPSLAEVSLQKQPRAASSCVGDPSLPRGLRDCAP